jgi:hypothetical protein
MDTKQRYRLRQRLQSALCRVIVAVADMHLSGLGPNADNLTSIGLTRQFLDNLLKLPRARGRGRPQLDAITTAVAKVENRRQQETRARNERRDRERERQGRPAVA